MHSAVRPDSDGGWQCYRFGLTSEAISLTGDDARKIAHVQLIWCGWAAVADDNPVWDLRRLSLTDAGQARYAQLREREACHLGATADRQSSDFPAPAPFEYRP